MDKLPNDIIMRIIREADGGRYQHKIYLKKVLENLKDDNNWFSFHLIRQNRKERLSENIYNIYLCDAIDYGIEKNVILREIYNEEEYSEFDNPCEYPNFGYSLWA